MKRFDSLFISFVALVLVFGFGMMLSQTRTMQTGSTPQQRMTSTSTPIRVFMPMIKRDPSPTPMQTPTATNTATPTATSTSTSTPTEPSTPTPTDTTTPTETATPTDTATATPTETSTRMPTSTTEPRPTFTSIPTPVGWVPVVREDFEGAFPEGWTVFDNNGAAAGEYYWDKRDCRKFSGRYSGWAVGGGANGRGLPCGSDYPGLGDSGMVYGPFSLEGAHAANFSTKMWTNTFIDDWTCLEASSDGHNFSGWCYAGGSQRWFDAWLDLSDVDEQGTSLLGRDKVWILISFSSDEFNTAEEGAFVDDVLVQKFFYTNGNVQGLIPTPILPEGVERMPVQTTRQVVKK